MKDLTGTTLPNAAIVCAHNANKVMCRFRGEYVVWSIDTATLAVYWGHYFKSDQHAALNYYNKVAYNA